jgi:hypothetical protein
VIAAQPRARRLVEIVRFNAQDAREFSDPLVRDANASVFIVADLPRRYVGGVGKLAHCHPAMLTVFLQALSDVWGRVLRLLLGDVVDFRIGDRVMVHAWLELEGGMILVAARGLSERERVAHNESVLR